MHASSWMRVGTLVAITALTACTAEPPPEEARGSWVEVTRFEQQPNAVFVADEPAITRVEVLPDRLILTQSGPLSKPIVADTPIAGMHAGIGFLRRAVSTTMLPDGRVEVLTEQGQPADFVKDLAFVVHYDPIMSGPVGAPALLGEEVGGARAALSDCEDRTPCDITSREPVNVFDGAGCTGSPTGRISLSPYISSTLKADFPFDGADNVGISAKGSISAGVILTASGGVSGSCTVDVAAALGGGEAPQVTLAKIPLPGLLVVLGPVDIFAQPIIEANVSAEIDAGEVTLEAGAKVTVDGFVGREGGEWEARLNPRFEKILPPPAVTRAGGLNLSATPTIGVKVGAKLAGVVSTEIATLTLEASLTATFDANLMCEWNAGLSAEVLAKVTFLSEEACVGWGPLEACISLFENPPEITIIDEGVTLGEASGRLAACGSTPIECTATSPRCADMVFDASVCEGEGGWQFCAGPAPAGSVYVQRCTCTASGWAACSSCMTIPAP
jgi:hypothetical protein